MSEKDIEYIRVAAYYIWENEGRPEGKSEEIWWKACDQMKNYNYGCKDSKCCAKKAAAKKPAAKASSAKLAKVAAKASPAVKVALKPAVKASPAIKLDAKHAVKASSVKMPAKKLAKSKISPVPVKSSAKIITPLYGSLKK